MMFLRMINARLLCMLVTGIIMAGCELSGDVQPSGDGAYIKFIGGAKDEFVHTGIQYSDGGYILAGETNSFFSQGTDAYVARTDASGNLIWEETFGGSGTDGFMDVKLVGTELLLFGYVTAGDGMRDFLLMRLDANGTILDSLTYGETGVNETGRFLLPASEGGYNLLGVKGKDQASSDIYMVRANNDYTVNWVKDYGLLDKFDEIGNVVESKDGNLIWCGTANKDGSNHVRLVKASPYGQVIWVVTFGEGDGIDEEGLMLTKGWGSYYALLSNTSSNNGDVTLRFVDGKGELVGSAVSYGGEDLDEAAAVCTTSDGGYVIAGTSEVGVDDSDVFLLKTDAAGNELWSNYYGGTGADTGNFVIQGYDNGLAVFSTITFENNTVFGLIKTDNNGNTL